MFFIYVGYLLIINFLLNLIASGTLAFIPDDLETV